MITLFRMIRFWQLKMKWKLSFIQIFDKIAMEIIKDPEEFEKKFVSAIAEIIHNENLSKANKAET